MYQNRLLCYKVSYCLGVEDYVLAHDFHKLHEISKEIGYFNSCPTARKYRALCRMFYRVTRHYELFTPGKSFGAVAGNRYKTYLKGTGIFPEIIYKDCANVLEFLNTLVGMSQRLLPALYEELKPSTDYLSFASVLRLEPMSELQMKQVQYILRRIPPNYCIYFFGSEVYNSTLRFVYREESKDDAKSEVVVEQGVEKSQEDEASAATPVKGQKKLGEEKGSGAKSTWFMQGLLWTDATLRTTISIATGRPADDCADTSALASELFRRAEKHFISATDIVGKYKNLFLLQYGLTAEQQAKVLSLFAENAAPITAVTDVDAFIDLWNKREDIHEGTALLCKVPQESLTTLLEACPTLDPCVVVPVSSTLYKEILAGSYPRVNLVSTH